MARSILRISLFLLVVVSASSTRAQDVSGHRSASGVEERYAERASSSILLVYDGRRLEPGLERVLISALEQAYADLVQDFGSGPVEKVVVVVYAERDFQASTRE
ncbi:MAG TPA: hypothetical protein VHP60_00905, partial [Thermoanaerobaculia bacterium]|nr:hypothetical protein [Thermoanaerobaculia bacterium]